MKKTEKSFSNLASHTTPWIEATTDLGALVPLRRPIRVKRAIQKLLASASTLLGNAVNSIKDTVNKGKVSRRRHTKKTVSIAGVSPHGTNLPFNRLPFVEMLALVFHNKNAAIGRHYGDVGVEFPVGQLQPEGRALPANVAHPVSDLFVPVYVQRRVLFFVVAQRANQRKEMVVAGKHVPLNLRGHQFIYGLGYEYYRAWLGDFGMNDAAVQPVCEGRQGPSRLPTDARKLAL